MDIITTRNEHKEFKKALDEKRKQFGDNSPEARHAEKRLKAFEFYHKHELQDIEDGERKREEYKALFEAWDNSINLYGLNDPATLQLRKEAEEFFEKNPIIRTLEEADDEPEKPVRTN